MNRFTLHNGPLEFSAISLGSGPVVLCVHGFPDTLNSFRHQMPALAEAGYRAVAVSLRGYEPSSQPADRDYSMEALAGDIIAWISELDSGPVHLVGHDWGAGIAYAAGAAAPEKFRSMTVMAVPHSGRFLTEARRYPRQLRLSWYMGFFQLRGVADWLTKRNDYALIRKLWRDWSPGGAIPEDALEDAVSALKQPGVLTASLDYYRTAITLSSLGKAAAEAAHYKVPVPTLAISGADDGCIDTHVFEKLTYEEDFPAGLRFVRIDGAGHFPHQEKPEEFNRLLLGWIAAHNEVSGEKS